MPLSVQNGSNFAVFQQLQVKRAASTSYICHSLMNALIPFRIGGSKWSSFETVSCIAQMIDPRPPATEYALPNVRLMILSKNGGYPVDKRRELINAVRLDRLVFEHLVSPHYI